MKTPSKDTLMLVDSVFAHDPNETGRQSSHRRLSRLALFQTIEGAVQAGIFATVGDALTILAENAYALKRNDVLEEAGKALISLPLGRKHKSAGGFFSALARIRKQDLEGGVRMLNQVVSEPSHPYTGRALHSLGWFYHFNGDVTSAVKLYLEAGRHSTYGEASNPLTPIYTQQNIAIIRGQEGDHLGALKVLQSLVPLVQSVRMIYPQAQYHILNSLAVELNEVGQHEEARRFSKIAISSPMGPVHSEWGETYRDIQSALRPASRSTVSVPQLASVSYPGQACSNQTQLAKPGSIKRDKLVSLSNRSTSNTSPAYAISEPARILDFQQWKQRVNPASPQLSALSSEQRKEMSIGDKLIRLMDLISHDDTDDETIDAILEAVEAIVVKRKVTN